MRGICEKRKKLFHSVLSTAFASIGVESSTRFGRRISRPSSVAARSDVGSVVCFQFHGTGVALSVCVVTKPCAVCEFEGSRKGYLGGRLQVFFACTSAIRLTVGFLCLHWLRKEKND